MTRRDKTHARKFSRAMSNSEFLVSDVYTRMIRYCDDYPPPNQNAREGWIVVAYHWYRKGVGARLGRWLGINFTVG